MSDPDEPQSFQEAWWGPDSISREKRREAIHLEFKKMLDMGVWRHVTWEPLTQSTSTLKEDPLYLGP